MQDIVGFAMYTVHCTVYSVHCTLYTVQCTLCIVRCSLYSSQYMNSQFYSLSLDHILYCCSSDHSSHWKSDQMYIIRILLIEYVSNDIDCPAKIMIPLNNAVRIL